MNSAKRFTTRALASALVGAHLERAPVGFDRGFYLRGTPLWIDAERRTRMCVLSGIAGRLPPRHERAVASLRLADVLHRVGYKGHVLPTPCGRWMGLGGMNAMLWDTGGPTVGAAVMFEQRGVRLLAMGTPTRRCLELPPADILALRAPALFFGGQPLRTVVERLQDFIAQVESCCGRGVILVDSVDVGLSLHAALTEAGEWVRAVGPLGKAVGMVSRPRVGVGRRKCRVTLALGSGRQPSVPDVVVIDSGSGMRWLRLPWVAQRAQTLSMQWLAGISEVAQMVAQTGARQVWVASASSLDLEALAGIPGSKCSVQFAGPAEQLCLPSARRAQLGRPAWEQGGRPVICGHQIETPGLL